MNLFTLMDSPRLAALNDVADAQRQLTNVLASDDHKLVCPFLRRYGQFFRPQPLPTALRAGRIGACYANSYRLLKRHGKHLGLAYAEGYAVSAQTESAHLHAWCIDREGNVYDRTWRMGNAYFGVVLKTKYVVKVMNLRKASGDVYFGFLDDWEKGCPLVTDLCERPDVWRHEWDGTEP